jgi:hypothetical protein
MTDDAWLWREALASAGDFQTGEMFCPFENARGWRISKTLARSRERLACSHHFSYALIQ